MKQMKTNFFFDGFILPECSVDVVLTLSTTVRVEFDTTTGRCSLETVTVLFIGGEDISTTLVIVYKIRKYSTEKSDFFSHTLVIRISSFDPGCLSTLEKKSQSN